MSQQNIEVVRESIEAYNRGDVECLRALYHPDVVLRMPAGWPEPGPFAGRDAVFSEFRRLQETWAEDSFDVLGDFLSSGDRVLARVAYRAAGSGPDAVLEITNVYTLRDALIIGLEFFRDHEQALAATGLAD